MGVYVGRYAPPGTSLCVLKNIIFEGGVSTKIRGEAYIGGIAGYSSGKMDDCSSDKKIELSDVSYVGGIAGLSSGEVKNVRCKAVLIEGKQYVGGLIGLCSGGSLSDSHSTVSLVKGDTYVGGIAGLLRGLITYPVITAVNNAACLVQGVKNVGGVCGGVGVGGVIENSENHAALIGASAKVSVFGVIVG